MGRRYLFTVMSIISAAILFSTAAYAANGTIRVTLKYKDNSGLEQSLPYAFLYLQNGTGDPPMEKFFRNAEYIFGPSDSAGRISASVPEGTYFIRVTRRETVGTKTRPLGPPETGDYTWSDYRRITVNANSIIDLGTQYALPFGQITITGAVVDKSTGAPLSGRYVRAQSEPCIEADYSSWDPADWVDTNRCGPVKHLAQQRTDAQGKYTLVLRQPGTYYIVESKTLGDRHQQYMGNTGSTGWSMGPITVNTGDTVTLNDMQVPSGY